MEAGGVTGGPQATQGGSPPVLLPPSIFYKIQNNSSLIFTAFGVAQNRYLKLAPFSGQNSSCRHSPSSCKPCKIREKRHKNCTVKWNNSPRSDKYQHESMMQNGRINSPKLRPRLSSTEAEINKYAHMFGDRGVDKTNYGHARIMIIIRTTISSYNLSC